MNNNNYVDRTIEIPENVADYIKTHDGTNLEISINAAFADYGYAHILHKAIIISKLTRTCHWCGYDPLWNPDDSESKCQRHTYDNWRYDPVFAWYPNAGIGLEEAFDDWLSIQPSENEFDKPAKYKKYGKAKW